MTASALASFLNDRWDEEERDCELFHELGCPATEPDRPVRSCTCPCPAHIRRRIAVHRRLLQDCERRIRQEQQAGLCWPMESILAFQTMKALALPFELHQAWRDAWYP